MGACEVLDPAAEGQSADAGGGDEAAGRRQPEGMGRVVDVAPLRATLDAHRAPLGIDPDTTHPRQIDHQSVVDGAQPRSAVPTATYGHRELLVARKVYNGMIDRKPAIIVRCVD